MSQLIDVYVFHTLKISAFINPFWATLYLTLGIFIDDGC